MKIQPAVPPRFPQRESRSIMVRIDFANGCLHVAGHLDRSTVHVLADAVATLLRTDHTAWTVDLRDLTACDPAGVRAIGALYRRALRHNRRVMLTGTPPALEQHLTRIRLHHHLLGTDDGTTASPNASLDVSPA